jgi:drug/metabolite transporter (DMT)-like permease
MNFSNPVYYFYIGASLFYIVDVLQKITSAHVNTYAYLMRRSAYTSIVSLLGSLLFCGISSTPSFQIICQIIGCSLLTYGGIYFYIKAINHLQFSNANSIYMVGNVVQQLTGIFLFNEKFHFWMLLSWMLMSFGCIYQMAFTKWSRGALYVLLSSLFWTAGYSLLSLVLKNGYEMWSVAIMESTILLVSILLLALTKGKRKELVTNSQTNHRVIYFLAIAVSLFAASYFNHLSFHYNPISIISLMQLSMMPLSFLLNMRIFKEKPSKIEWISFGTGIAGFLVFVVFS